MKNVCTLLLLSLGLSGTTPAQAYETDTFQTKGGKEVRIRHYE